MTLNRNYDPKKAVYALWKDDYSDHTTAQKWMEAVAKKLWQYEGLAIPTNSESVFIATLVGVGKIKLSDDAITGTE